MASFFSRLNPVPTFPPLTGPHNVGTVDIELDASELQDESSTFTPVPTIAFRCFYPCETPTKPASPAYWVQSPQRDIISAYCRFVGAGSALSNIIAYFSQLLYRVQIPAHRNATLLPPTSEKGKWPVMIFSHGLGGSRNSYSYICSSLASHGIFVVAAEHRDGSAPISHVRATSTTPATTGDYQRYSHTPSSEVYQGRDEMLKTRIWELALIQQALQKIEAGTGFCETDTETAKQDKHSSKDVLGGFQNRLTIDKPGCISFAGHSFGAATVVQYVKSLYYYNHDGTGTQTEGLLAFKPTQTILKQITRTTPAILLDLWALPLNSPDQYINKLPMPYYTSTADRTSSQTPNPILAVLSRAFVNWTGNFNDVKRHLADPKPSASAHLQPALLFYPTASAHLSQSDFGVLFPRVTKYFANADEPERTLELNVRAILQMLRKRGVEVAGTQDEEILSTKEGTVRGWTAIGADEAAPGKLEEVQVHERPNGLAHSQTSESKGGQIAEAQVVMNGEISGAREQAVQG